MRNENQRKNVDDSMDLRAAQYVASDIEGGQQEGAAGADNLRRPEQAVRVKRYRSARGPTMMARIGTLRALNRHVERVFDSSRKEMHWDNVS